MNDDIPLSRFCYARVVFLLASLFRPLTWIVLKFKAMKPFTETFRADVVVT